MKKVLDNNQDFEAKVNMDAYDFFRQYSKEDLIWVFNLSYVRKRLNFCYEDVEDNIPMSEENCWWIRNTDRDDLSLNLTDEGLGSEILLRIKKDLDRRLSINI